MQSSRSVLTPVRIVAAIVVVVILGVLLLRGGKKDAPSAVAAVDAPLELAPADVSTVAMRPLARTLPLSGSVQPVNQATIKSKVAGQVLEMNLREGEAARKGDVLVRIDTRSAGPNRDSASAALEKAKADLAIAKLNYGNSQKLFEQKFVSQNAVDSTRAIYDAAAANAKAAGAALQLAAVALEDTTVRAPFDGIVARRDVQVGDKVSIDSPVVTLVDLSKMEMDAPAPASEIPSVKVGQSAKFRVDGFADRSFVATVWRVNPVAEQGSRSIMVYLTVPNLDNALKGGMFAQGELALDAGSPVPSVPLAAVRDNSGASFVWVVDGEVLKRRDVELGLKAPGEGMVEIRSGVKAGEQVVVAKIDTLKEGGKVKVMPAAAVPTPAPAPAADVPKPAAAG